MTKHKGDQDQAAEGNWPCPAGRALGAGDGGLGEGARPPAAALCRGRQMKGGCLQAVTLALGGLGSGCSWGAGGMCAREVQSSLGICSSEAPAQS